MVLEGLGKSLRNVLGRIGSASSVDEELIKDICKDLQRALLEADVNVRLVLDVTNRVKERALNEAPEAGRSMKDHVVRIIREELVRMVNSDVPGIAVKPQTIMMVGLYGQGKTTTTGKLALYFSKKNLTVGLIGADVYRPAALDQLKQLGEKVGVEVYGEPGQTDAALIVKHGLEHFKDKKMVIIDTSGRHALEDDLIDEEKQTYIMLKAPYTDGNTYYYKVPVNFTMADNSDKDGFTAAEIETLRSGYYRINRNCLYDITVTIDRAGGPLTEPVTPRFHIRVNDWQKGGDYNIGQGEFE